MLVENVRACLLASSLNIDYLHDREMWLTYFLVCSVQVVVWRTNEELVRLKSLTLLLPRLCLHSADLTLRNQWIARDQGADGCPVPSCLRKGT